MTRHSHAGSSVFTPVEVSTQAPADRPLASSNPSAHPRETTASAVERISPAGELVVCQQETLIQTRSLSLHYAGTPAFEDVSLSFKRGRITALIGPSGCGKTSFLSCLNRLTDLIPACRVSGRVIVGNTDIHATQTNVVQLRRRVGMIFQKPNPFPISIRRNIELPVREHLTRNRAEVGRIVESVLRDVGLWDEVKDRLHAPAHSLSGGQQQRLCFARALALKPEVILLDEPCSALDPISTGVIEDLLESLKGRYTIVIVTHNLAQARRIADEAAMFWIRHDTGCMVECGDAEQLFTNPRNPITAAYVAGHRG